LSWECDGRACSTGTEDYQRDSVGFEESTRKKKRGSSDTYEGISLYCIKFTILAILSI
jgi:hypothetical protein